MSFLPLGSVKKQLVTKHSKAIPLLIGTLNSHPTYGPLHDTVVHFISRLMGLGSRSTLPIDIEVGTLTRKLVKENHGITTLVASMNTNDSVKNLKVLTKRLHISSSEDPFLTFSLI